MRSALRWAKHTLLGVINIGKLGLIREQGEYLTRELSRLAAAQRRAQWQQRRGSTLGAQTRASFDYQWEHIPAGRALPSDDAFMRGVEAQICQLTQLPREWFAGKRVVDVGCGIGRFSYGLLKLGAAVTACDQSEAALRRTAELCDPFRDRLSLKRIDLLDWSEPGDFDLAWSFGVVHHTGNTYLATENVCRKVGPGGRVFLMIYGVPTTRADLAEVNEYEHITEEVRGLSFEQRKDLLIARFGPDAAHGWFDAISPRINDRLSFEEIHDLLTELGFAAIRLTATARDHHVIADRTGG